MRPLPLRAPTCKYPAKAIAGRFPIGATYPRHLRPPERGGSPRSGKYALCANIMEVPAVETSAWHLRSVPLRAPTCKYPAKAIAGRFPIGATYPRHLRPPRARRLTALWQICSLCQHHCFCLSPSFSGASPATGRRAERRSRSPQRRRSRSRDRRCIRGSLLGITRSQFVRTLPPSASPPPPPPADCAARARARAGARATTATRGASHARGRASGPRRRSLRARARARAGTGSAPRASTAGGRAQAPAPAPEKESRRKRWRRRPRSRRKRWRRRPRSRRKRWRRRPRSRRKRWRRRPRSRRKRWRRRPRRGLPGAMCTSLPCALGSACGIAAAAPRAQRGP